VTFWPTLDMLGGFIHKTPRRNFILTDAGKNVKSTHQKNSVMHINALE